MERCQEHMVADGQIERSKKMDGLVERTRRCDLCGSLFKTFELTDDKIAHKQAEHDSRVMKLVKELGYFEGMVEKIKEIYVMEEMVRNEIQREFGLGSKDGG